jgi:DNA-binding IclR family transcriptional regulator
VAGKKADSEREMRKKERMEKEMKELKQTLENRAHEIKAKQHTISQGEDQAGTNTCGVPVLLATSSTACLTLICFVKWHPRP